MSRWLSGDLRPEMAWCRVCFALMLWPVLPASGVAADVSPFSAWVTKGWVLEKSINGDLDVDGVDDAVLVLLQNDRRKRKRNQGLGALELDTNPRRLLVLLKSAEGYRKVADNARFLPPQNDEETPCLADPLEEGGVAISRGLLRIELHHWLSCGSWGVSHSTFLFRLEGGRLRLIGMDGYEYMRNSGERSESSVNFLTGKKKTTTGLNEFDESAKPQVTWGRITARTPIYLDQMGASCDEGDPSRSWCQ